MVSKKTKVVVVVVVLVLLLLFVIGAIITFAVVARKKAARITNNNASLELIILSAALERYMGRVLAGVETLETPLHTDIETFCISKSLLNVENTPANPTSKFQAAMELLHLKEKINEMVEEISTKDYDAFHSPPTITIPKNLLIVDTSENC
jgi:hypothetical protein